MSTHRPTPHGFPRRAPMLLITLGLGVLVGSCESEQTGYEVTLPLIGPIEFNQMSCEISEDVCTSDDECVDEDGFFVGPCTQTLTAREPIAVTISHSPSNPSYTLPAFETGRWLAPLAVLQNTDENPIVFATDSFSISGGPVTILVEPFSRNGLYLGRDAGYEPVLPSTGSCEFVLDDSSTGQDYSDGISNCLRDWVKENGAPLQFDIRVTSSAGVAASSAGLAAAKSGFGLKQESYSITGGGLWDTNDRCEGEVSEEVLEAVAEGGDFFGLLECTNQLQFTGEGWTSEPINIRGVATIYDRCGNNLAFGNLGSAVDSTGGTFVPIGPNSESDPYTVQVFESADFVPQSNVVPVSFFSDAEDFVRSLFVAASGECEGASTVPVNDPNTGLPSEMGLAVANWEHCYAGDLMEPPERDGSMTFGASGFCPVAGEPSPDGGTDPDGGDIDGGF